jgi:hypothetical protein
VAAAPIQSDPRPSYTLNASDAPSTLIASDAPSSTTAPAVFITRPLPYVASASREE